MIFSMELCPKALVLLKVGEGFTMKAQTCKATIVPQNYVF
jgi:hypothetical protein